MDNQIVVFTKNNARILHNPNRDMLAKLKQHVINPDLSAVRGYPPHYWKLVDGQILPMTKQEQSDRMKHIDENGIDNGIEGVYVLGNGVKHNKLPLIYLIAPASAIISGIIVYLLMRMH